MDKVNVLSSEMIAVACGADILGPPRSAVSVCIDSRQCESGSLFVPLKGGQTDGHFYIGSAVEKGSSLCFVHRRFYHEHKGLFASLTAKFEVTFLLVDDSLKALQDVASSHMRKQRNLTVIGITGSNGKTTTKELLAGILALHGHTAKNTGNLNSEIGLPLSVLDIDEEHRYAVLEMGMNRRGEMDVLAGVARPEYAAITNIGTAHIGLLGSREAIAAEKARVFQYIDDSGTGFIREDDDFKDFLELECPGPVKLYGPGTTLGYEGYTAKGLKGSLLNLDGKEVMFPLIGEVNVVNALCAVSMAQELGVASEAIAAGLEAAEPLFGRGQVFEGEVTVIEDCYNANGESMVKAMDFVDALPWTGRKILVLGSMKELGTESEKIHGSIGGRAADSNASMVLFFGEESAAAYDAAVVKSGSDSDRLFWTDDFSELSSKTESVVKSGDLVLLKGSRGVALERLGEKLRDSS